MSRPIIKTYISKERGVYSVVETDNTLVIDDSVSSLTIDGPITIAGPINVVGPDAVVKVNGEPISGSGGEIIVSGSVGPHIETITVVTSNYTINNTDYIIGVSGTMPLIITLPVTPELGRTYVIKNLTGGINFQPVTVSSTTHLIDGNPTFTMSINYQSLNLAFFGSSWGIY